MSTIKLFCFATQFINCFSVFCLKSVSSQKRPKSVLDTDNPYQVACLQIVDRKWKKAKQKNLCMNFTKDISPNMQSPQM